MEGNACSASDEAVEGAIEQLVLQSVQTQSALVQLQQEHNELRQTLARKHKAYENKLQTLLSSNKNTESKLTALQQALQQQQRQRQQQQQQQQAQQQAQQQRQQQAQQQLLLVQQQQEWQEQQQREQAQQQQVDQKQQPQPLMPQQQHQGQQQQQQQQQEQLYRELVQEESVDIAHALSQGAAPLFQPAEQQQPQQDAFGVSEPVSKMQQQQQQQQHAEKEKGGDAARGEAQPPCTNGDAPGTSHTQQGQQEEQQQQQQQHSSDTKPAASRRGKRKFSGAGETEVFDKKLSQELKGTMKQVLVAIKKHKEIAEDFLEPVWELWPEDIRREDYVRQVPEPMDLKTLGKLVNEGAFELTYQGYEHFKSKLILIGNNCKSYNRGDEEFCKKAQAFIDVSSKIWEQKWDEVVSKVFSSGLMP